MSKELLTFIKKLHDQSIELLRGVTFNAGPQSDRLILGTYASMIEFCGATLILVNGNGYIAVPLVFRSLLETYVNFTNAIADLNYAKHYDASHHKHWIKVLKETDEPNPLLAGIHGHAERANALKRHQDEFAKLKQAGVEPLDIRSRFERAGMKNEYESVYVFESDSVHTSLQALMERHFELKDNRLGLALYKPRSLQDCLGRLDSTAALLLDASQVVHARYKSGREKDVEALGHEFQKLRATYA
ncbi:MAG: hypothetical protein JJE37_10615 [Methyloceanibacter sp.]|nr:hypothetical protein [Methyloceanibacter sp.]